jgi:hypothetical protein
VNITITRERAIFEVDTSADAVFVANAYLGIKKSDERFAAYANGEIRKIVVKTKENVLADGGGWSMEFVESEYGVPFWKFLAKRTGIDTGQYIPLPSLNGLYHTHAAEGMVFNVGTQKVTGFITKMIYPYQGEKLDEAGFFARAKRDLLFLLDNALGEPHVEREMYLERGRWRKNKFFGVYRQIPPKMVAYHPKVWKDFWMWWEKHHATEGQREVLAARHRFSSTDTHPGLECRHIGLDGFRRVIEWDEFKTL